MGSHQLTVDGDGVLRLHLKGEFTAAEFAAMLQGIREHLDRADSPLGILITREDFGFPPTEGQLEAGRLTRHPRLGRIAVLGQQLFGGAVSDLIGALGKKRFRYFDTEAEARAFLLAPLDPD
jgi:hypothetical protein